MPSTPSVPTLDIAVTGATGQQGSALVELLAGRGHRVRALTRRPEAPAARALTDRGIEVVRADLDDDVGVREAVAGADALFLLTTPFERGAAAEVVQARNAGRAAAAAGLRHVVYSSVTQPMTFSPIEHFRAKGEAERQLQALDLPLTIIGAPPFADNLIAPWHLRWLQQGVFALPVPDPFPMQMVLTRDIAAVAAHVLERRDAFIGQRLDIATESISGRAIREALEAASGRTFVREHKSFAELDPMLGRLFAGVDFGGGGAPPPAAGPSMNVDIEALRQRVPEVRWSTIAGWVGELDWPRLLALPKQA